MLVAPLFQTVTVYLPITLLPVNSSLSLPKTRDNALQLETRTFLLFFYFIKLWMTQN